MDDEAAAKEEARILASLEVAKKNAQKNAFGGRRSAVKATPAPIQPAPQATKPAVQATMGGGGGGGGQIPAWKQQQLDKERRDQEKSAEEERKRREKLNQINDGVIEESVVTLGGPTHYHDINGGAVAAATTGGGGRGGGEIDSTSVAKETDYEMQMKMEEDRLLNKVKNTAPKQKTAEVQQKRVEHAAGFGKKVKVTWIDRNTEKPIQSFDWYCSQDRLPLKAIMHEWKIRNVLWADVEQPIGLTPDGFSDMTFEGISHLKIFADRI